jgi:NADH-quinone oxidoreductase subunit M
MPRYAFFCVFMALASFGLPGLSGFVGEFLSLAGAFSTLPFYATIASIGLIAVVALFLFIIRKVLWEKPKDDIRWPDMSFSEIAVILPLAVITLAAGFYPDSILQFQQQAVELLMKGL